MKIFERDRLAIDLGAHTTRIYINEELVLEQMSAIMYFCRTGKVAALGDSVRWRERWEPMIAMSLSKHPGDFGLICDLLKNFIGQIRPRRLFWNPVVAIAIDLDMSEEDRNKLRSAIPDIIQSSRHVRKLANI